MKKIIILLLALISLEGISQMKSWTDSIAPGDIGGTDTVIWAAKHTNYRFGYGYWSIEIKYHQLDQDDATFSVVVANFSDSTWNVYSQIGTSSFPYTLDVTTNGYTNQAGNTVATKAWEDENLSFDRFGIRITKGNVTSGYVIWSFKQN